jgi:hypothetical protein
VFRFPPLTPFVKKLLIALFGAWIMQIILQNWAGVPIFEFLALNTAQPGLHTLWQLGTHVFAFPTGPQAVFSMLITLVFLWWMLAPFEQRFGEKRTIQLCVVAALSAAFLALIVGLMVPSPSALYGAQALLLGSIAAFAWSYRGQGRMSFFGVIDMKPVHIIYLVLALSAPQAMRSPLRPTSVPSAAAWVSSNGCGAHPGSGGPGEANGAGRRATSMWCRAVAPMSRAG